MEYGCISVIIEDLSFRQSCVPGLVCYRIIDRSVLFLAGDLVCDISVMIVDCRKPFFLVLMMRKCVIVVDMFQFNSRWCCIYNVDCPRVFGSQGKELCAERNGVGSGFMNIDTFGRDVHRNRMMDKAQDRSGQFCGGTFILIGNSALADHLVFSVQMDLDPPLVNAKDEDQDHYQHRRRNDHGISDSGFMPKLLRKRRTRLSPVILSCHKNHLLCRVIIYFFCEAGVNLGVRHLSLGAR